MAKDEESIDENETKEEGNDDDEKDFDVNADLTELEIEPTQDSDEEGLDEADIASDDESVDDIGYDFEEDEDFEEPDRVERKAYGDFSSFEDDDPDSDYSHRENLEDFFNDIDHEQS